MKIIGKSDGGFILDATETEIAQIMGFSCNYESGYHNAVKAMSSPSRDDRLFIGAVIPVSGWWKRVESIRQHNRDLQKTADTMRGLADLIADSWPAVEAFVEKATGS
jgi:hypothetical protein